MEEFSEMKLSFCGEMYKITIKSEKVRLNRCKVNNFVFFVKKIVCIFKDTFVKLSLSKGNEPKKEEI